MHKIAIVGGGSWGTALAIVAAHKNRYSEIRLLLRNQETADMINRHRVNSKYINNCIIPENVSATTNMCDISDADCIVLAVPTQATREVCRLLQVKKGASIVVTAKGIEMNSLLLVGDVVRQVLPDVEVATICGPNLARQVGSREPSITTVAASNMHVAQAVADMWSSPSFAVEVVSDLTGVQVCGAVKNVLAIAFGMVVGLNCADNTKAKVFSRGIEEMRTACIALGGSSDTVYCACGVGDLFLSCYSIAPRNTAFGFAMAKGLSTEEYPEGYYTSAALYALSTNLNIDLPLCTQVYKILYEGQKCEQTSFGTHF